MKLNRKIFFSWDNLITTAIVFLSMLLFPLIFQTHYLDAIRDSLADLRISDITYNELRDENEFLPDENIILINIDTLDNCKLGFIISRLKESNAKVIGICNILNKSNDLDCDEFLASEVSGINNIVFANKYQAQNDKLLFSERKLKSDNYFSQNSTQGYLNIFIDKDIRYSTAREFPPFIRNSNKIDTAFAVQIVNKFDPKLAEQLSNRGNEFEEIFYRGNARNFFRVDANEILNPEENLGFVKGKIVLLGKVGTGKPYLIKDGYFTPLNENSVGRAFPDMYEMVLQANIISMIIEGNYYYTMSFEVSIVLAIIFCYLNIVLFTIITQKSRKWYEILSLLIFMVESIFILYITVMVYHYFRINLNMTLTIFAIAISLFVFEGYKESIKPLTIRTYKRIIRLFEKKEIKESEI